MKRKSYDEAVLRFRRDDRVRRTVSRFDRPPGVVCMKELLLRDGGDMMG